MSIKFYSCPEKRKKIYKCTWHNGRVGVNTANEPLISSALFDCSERITVILWATLPLSWQYCCPALTNYVGPASFCSPANVITNGWFDVCPYNVHSSSSHAYVNANHFLSNNALVQHVLRAIEISHLNSLENLMLLVLLKVVPPRKQFNIKLADQNGK